MRSQSRHTGRHRQAWLPRGWYGRMIRLRFWGAAQTVTGSLYELAVDGVVHMLVDCGLFQGGPEADDANRNPFPFDPASLDLVVLTHAHLDHSGRIPLLYKRGFRGRVICTLATADLCRVLWPDSGHIQEADAEWRRRKAQRAGREAQPPLYTAQEAQDALGLLDGVPYEEPVPLAPGLILRFRDAGHILGSAMAVLDFQGPPAFRLIFSGDLGQVGAPILRDPAQPALADCLVMESTYGGRRHPPSSGRRQQLAEIIQDTFSRGGKLVIPAFAVERTQDLIYELNALAASGQLPDEPVFVDSPLAISATEIFSRHPECFDRLTWQQIQKGDMPLDLVQLRFTRTTEESQSINGLKGPAIILSASGMADAGRIRHHLKHNLWRPEATVLFVGYQAPGTLGWSLLNGARQVRILGEEVAVKARIVSLSSFSGHADEDGLAQWVAGFRQLPPRIFLTHGEPEAQKSLAARLQQLAAQRGERAAVTSPAPGEQYTLEPAADLWPAAVLRQRLQALAEHLDQLTPMERAHVQRQLSQFWAAMAGPAEAGAGRDTPDAVK